MKTEFAVALGREDGCGDVRRDGWGHIPSSLLALHLPSCSPE